MNNEPRPSQLKRTEFFNEAVPFEMTIPDLDLQKLYDAFQPLLESAAHKVQTMGYEQDDAVFITEVICKNITNDNTFTAPAQWFKFEDKFIKDITTASNEEIQIDTITIEKVQVRAVLERWE